MSAEPKAKTMRESKVETHLIDRVTATGGFTRKLVFVGRRGAPDRLVGWPQRHAPDRGWRWAPIHVFIELKRPLTPVEEDHQKREHERLRAIGFDVRVLATIEEVDRFIEEQTG